MNEAEFLRKLAKKKPITYQSLNGYIARCKFLGRGEGDTLKLHCSLINNTKDEDEFLDSAVDEVFNVFSSAQSETEARKSFNEIAKRYGSNNLVEAIDIVGTP